MSLPRLSTLAFLLVALNAAASAQRPGPEFRRLSDCELGQPRTKLEELETSYERVLLKGFTQVATLNVRGADIRVDAVELKDARLGGERAMGLAIVLREQTEAPREGRSFVDYEDIGRLISAMESATRVNESVTRLAGFEARYRTKGDLEIRVFRQSRGSGTAASLSSGICDRVVALLTIDEMDRLRAHIVEAKARLDEIK